MMKTVYVFLEVLIMSVFLVSCTVHKDNNSNDLVDLDDVIENMTLEKKLGQMLVMDFRTWKTTETSNATSFEAMNSEVASVIADYHIGSIILFSENLKDTEKSVHLISDIQNTAISSGNLPLLIGVDQEGGIVTRLGQGTCMSGNMALGATNNLQYAYQTGQIIGEELAAIGINCNYAPDVDVNNNPKNPVINLRSFGSNPDCVSNLGVSMMKGLQSQGIISTAKHFPGHGDTIVDSHTGLPMVNKTLDELEKVELIPFRTLIDAGVQIIMSAHIQFPNIDNTKYKSKKDGSEIYVPATLSKKIMTDVLRNRLKYDGVLITDAMNMKAISDNFNEYEAIKMSINAGADLICMPTTISSKQDLSKLDNIFNILRSAVANGEIPVSRIDESVRRIVKLKLNNEIISTEKYKKPIHQKVENALEVVGSKEHRKIERQISGDAITLIKNDNVLPFNKLLKNQKILVIVPFENNIPSVRFSINRLISEGKIPNIKLNTYCYKEQTLITNDLKNLINDSNYIIILTQLTNMASLNKNCWNTAMPVSIINYINRYSNQNKLVLISTGAPYDLVAYTNAPALLLAYGYIGMDLADIDSPYIIHTYGPNIPAAIEACFGISTPNKFIPVNLKI